MSDTGGARRKARGEGERRGADERLNLAIDLTVRQMLDVEQPAGLRGRVLQRIDARADVAFDFRRKLLWSSLPLAAAAMLILAVMAPWRTSAPTPVPRARPQIAGDERPAVAGSAAFESTGSSAAPRTRVRQDPPRPAAASAAGMTPQVTLGPTIVAAAVSVEGGVEIDPLATIDPIRIDPVGPTAIEHKEVVVPPLAVIAQLQTAPLSISDGRF